MLKKLDEPPRCQSDAHARAAVRSLTPASRFSTSRHQVEPTVNGDEYDELHIPSGKTTPDAVLQWPIFDSKYPPGYLTDVTFAAELPDDESDEESPSAAMRQPSKTKGGIDEDAIMGLVQRFLDHVHIKNPILETEMIWNYAQRVAEDGVGWDCSSCFVVRIPVHRVHG